MKQLQGQGVRIPTIFLSHRNESGLAKQALDAGAAADVADARALTDQRMLLRRLDRCRFHLRRQSACRYLVLSA